MEHQHAPIGSQIGGTVIAFFVALIVIAVVSSVVAFLMSLFQYYLGNVRWEAAIFIGNVAGGIASIYAARSACDATIKHYSAHAIFIIIALLLVAFLAWRATLGFDQELLFRSAFAIPTIIVGYIVFWKGDF